MCLSPKLAATPGIAFLAFTLGYFGTVLPHTMRAKRIVYSGGREGLIRGLHWPVFIGPAWVLIARIVLAATVALVAWAVVRQWRRTRAARWPAVSVVVSLLLFAVYFEQDSLIFTWYWPLLLFPLTLGAAGAINRFWWALPAGLLIGVGGVVSPDVEMLRAFVSNDLSRYPLFAENLRVVQYEALARHLKEIAPEGTILTSEIGGIGWGSYPNKVIDGAGLVSPEALKYHPMKVPEDRGSGTWGCIPPALVGETKPTFIVSLPLFSQALRGAMKKGRVTGYEVVESWPVIPPEYQALGMPNSLWGNEYIRVYGHPVGSPP